MEHIYFFIFLIINWIVGYVGYLVHIKIFSYIRYIQRNRLLALLSKIIVMGLITIFVVIYKNILESNLLDKYFTSNIYIFSIQFISIFMMIYLTILIFKKPPCISRWSK